MRGRTSEQEVISRVLDAPGEGALIVCGSRSGGKTTVLEGFRASEGAALVRVNPHEHEWPLSALSAVAAALDPARASATRRLLATADDLDASQTSPASGADPRDRVLASRMLAALHVQAPERVTLLIDDVDVADPRSATIIAYLAGRLGGTNIRIVATVTEVVPRAFTAFEVTEMRSPDPAARLAIARSILPARARASAVRVVSEFAGDGFAALRTVELSDRELTGGPIALPLAVAGAASRAAGASLHPDPAGPRSALITALALGPPLVIDHVLAVCAESGDAEDLGHTLAGLVADGVVRREGDRVSLADPRSRSESVRAAGGSPHAEQSRIRARIADAVRSHDEPLAAFHESFLAGTRSSQQRAEIRDTLLDGAEAAARAADVTTAIEFSERAATIESSLPSTPTTAEALLRLARAFHARGEFHLAERALERVDTTTAPAATAVVVAQMLMRAQFELSGRIEPEAVDSAVSLWRDSAPAACSRLLTSVAAMHLEQWRFECARTRFDQAVAVLTGGTDAGDGNDNGDDGNDDDDDERLHRDLVEATLRVVEGGSGPSPHPVIARAESATVHELNRMHVHEITLMLRLLILADHHGAARRVVASLSRSSHELGPLIAEEVAFLSVLNEVRAHSPIRAIQALGRLEAAALRARPRGAWHAYIGAAVDGMTPSRGSVPSAGATVRHHGLGSLDEALSIARDERNTVVLLLLEILAAEKALDLGDAARAAAVLTDVARRDTGPRNPSLLRYRADLVEALSATGHLPAANEALVAMEADAAASPTIWNDAAIRRARAACAKPGGAADTAFTLAFAKAAGAPEEKRRLDRTAENRRIALGGSTRAAVNPLPSARATALFERLTSQEAEVADLVRLGLRNRDIAAALYISLRTVELRLTSIYRKVGVTSRARLLSIIDAEPAHRIRG